MLNIIKYDWMKRWKFFASGILLFLYVNYSVMYGESNNIAFMLTLALGIMVIALIIDQVGRIYQVLYSDEGLLVFSLPISGFKLLAAKLIAVVLECISVLTIISVSTYVYLQLAGEAITLQVKELFEHFPEVANVVAFLIVGYIAWILIFHLATILTKSVFAFAKYGKLLTIVLFLVLNEITFRVVDVMGNVMGFMHGYNSPVGIQEWSVLLLLVTVYFTVSGYLLDRKLNL